jgi:hypothetical protein
MTHSENINITAMDKDRFILAKNDLQVDVLFDRDGLSVVVTKNNGEEVIGKISHDWVP